MKVTTFKFPNKAQALGQLKALGCDSIKEEKNKLTGKVKGKIIAICLI